MPQTREVRLPAVIRSGLRICPRLPEAVHMGDKQLNDHGKTSTSSVLTARPAELEPVDSVFQRALEKHQREHPEIR